MYPPVHKNIIALEEQLVPSQSILLKISAAEQRDFTITPQETRYYNFQTFGSSDSNNGFIRGRKRKSFAFEQQMMIAVRMLMPTLN